MAITVTVAELMGALRMGDSALETAEATRLLATASELVINFAPGAPTSIQDEATIRTAGYLFDMPYGGSSMVQNPLRLSGASALLARYRRLRAGLISDNPPESGTWRAGWRFDDSPVTAADLVVRSEDGRLEIPNVVGEERLRWIYVTGPYDQARIENPGERFLEPTPQLLEVAGAVHRVWRTCTRVPSGSISTFRLRDCLDA